MMFTRNLHVRLFTSQSSHTCLPCRHHIFQQLHSSQSPFYTCSFSSRATGGLQHTAIIPGYTLEPYDHPGTKKSILERLGVRTPNINWFPGHMVKAMNALSIVMQRCDCVVEVRDARVPFSSANPLLDSLILERKKTRIIVLNKSDLVNRNEVQVSLYFTVDILLIYKYYIYVILFFIILFHPHNYYLLSSLIMNYISIIVL